jgi:L,D-transpeptidase YcbB
MKSRHACWALLPAAMGLVLPSAGPVWAEPTPTWAAPATVYEPVTNLPAKSIEAPAAVAPTPLVPSPAAAAPDTTPAASSASNAVVDAIRAKLADKASNAKANVESIAALTSFYASRSEPVWVKDVALTARAREAITEIKNADAYGLEVSAFALPDLSPGASASAQADAEVKLDLAVLKYANHARGGRVEPLALSNILDMKLTLKDPKDVLADIAKSDKPAAYLRGLHPKHAGFEKLRQALAAARGPQVEEKIDEALTIKLPEGKTIKPGEESDDIALLRKRLKIEAASASNEKLLDAKLESALKEFQEANDLKANGQLTAKTRTAINRAAEPKKFEPKRDVERIIVNMERWRWLPEDLSNFYVMNNIPEFMSRVVKGNTEVLKQKIIVGQPTWPTPVLTSSMEVVIFHPEWGVPDGIKVKELLPRLKRASSQYSNSGGGFFDQLFNGGQPTGGGARVMAAYKLNPTINGKPVDANAVDWNRVDIKQFSFVQPAGAENPLGLVKFRFPNRHDVYMHDTPQRGLFAQSFRALSHGCMRLEQPRKLADVILGEDKGWSSDKVGGLYAGTSNEIKLSSPVPVYLTYFTARVDEDGKVQKYSDLYGHDERLLSALRGNVVRYDAPNHSDEGESSISDNSDAPLASKKSANQKNTGKPKRYTQSTGNILSDALNGLLAN